MFVRLLESVVRAGLLVCAASFLAQPAHVWATEPYGPYGYTPGAYDYSSSPSYSWTYRPTYS